MDTLEFTTYTHAVEETHELGQRLGALAQPGLVIALHGELGAGKTALAQGIARGLGIHERVTSPTFTLVNLYPTPQGWHLVHIDCYRLGESATEASQEAAAMGFTEILADEHAIIVIEWAERVSALLPPELLSVTLSQSDASTGQRRLFFQANGAQRVNLLNQIALTSA